MATYNLNMADEKLIDQITDIDALTQRIPRIQTFLEGIQDKKTELRQAGNRGQFTRTSGWWKDGSMQYAGTLPVSIKAAIEQIDPEFFKSPAKTLRFFSQHPEYIVTEVVG